MINLPKVPYLHEYLRREDFYESRSVSKGRKTKYCEHCGKVIPIGEAHETLKFYPEFTTYAVHRKCEEAFMESLITPENEKWRKFQEVHNK